MFISAKQKNKYWTHLSAEIMPSFRITALVGVILIFISSILPDFFRSNVPPAVTFLKYVSISFCALALASSYVFPKFIKQWFQMIYLVAVILNTIPNALNAGLMGNGWENNNYIINLIHTEVAFTLFLPSTRRYGITTLLLVNSIYLSIVIYFSPATANTSNAPFVIIHQVTMLIICIYAHYVIIRVRYKNYLKTLKIEQQNSELLQKNLRLKINPHFIFNALTSITNLTHDKKNEEAHTQIIQFSNLLRLNLEKSDELYHSLEEEKEFLEHYLELHHSMMHNFSFELDIHPDLDIEDIQIPAFIIQPYLENALIHAFQKKEQPKLWIRIHPRPNDHLHIEIEDNGIGRKAASELKDRKSLGMEITENHIKSLHKNDRVKIQISDLYDHNNQASGTKVTLTTPYQRTF